jgi:hypothetical protein
MIEFIVLRHQVSMVQGESLQIQQHPFGKFGMYARVSHILLSLLGLVYFGYLHSPYVVL